MKLLLRFFRWVFKKEYIVTYSVQDYKLGRVRSTFGDQHGDWSDRNGVHSDSYYVWRWKKPSQISPGFEGDEHADFRV